MKECRIFVNVYKKQEPTPPDIRVPVYYVIFITVVIGGVMCRKKYSINARIEKYKGSFKHLEKKRERNIN